MMDGVEVVVMDFKMVQKMGNVSIYHSLFLWVVCKGWMVWGVQSFL